MSTFARQLVSTDERSDSGDAVRWILGLIFLLVAAGASGLLLLKEMGVIGDSLPGCGPESACGDLSRGFFGSVPGIGWPTSYLGFTFFIAMIMAWSTCWPIPPRPIVWITRLGAIMSLMFMIIIFVEWKLCPYCIASHVANFCFWLTVEYSARLSRKGPPSMISLLTFIVSWIITTVLLAGGQAQVDHFDLIARQANENQNIDQIVMATMQGGSVNPLEDSANDADEEETDAEDDGIAFRGKRKVVDDPSAFTGRYLAGSPEAPVKVVMLSDYQCPDCKTFETQVASVLQSRDDVSLSVIHFPFNVDCNPHVSRTLHSNACWAAKFAETAGILGGNESFWDAHVLLFERKGRFTQEDFGPMVEELGFDPTTFQTIMTGPAVDALVQEDVKIGSQLGVYFTPMIFINGVQYKWYQTNSRLPDVINRIAGGIAAGTMDPTLKSPPTTAVKYIEDWRDGMVRKIPDTLKVSKGKASDPNSIVIYGDYTDPLTGEVADRIEAMREIYPGIRFDILAFPKNSECNSNIKPSFDARFPGACIAARAVKTAALVGGQKAYWDMIKFVRETGPTVTTPEILDAADSLGMDRNEFMTKMASDQVKALVQTDIMRARGFGVRSLPAIFIDGKHLVRYKLEDQPIIERAIKIAVTGKEDT